MSSKKPAQSSASSAASAAGKRKRIPPTEPAQQQSTTSRSTSSKGKGKGKQQATPLELDLGNSDDEEGGNQLSIDSDEDDEDVDGDDDDDEDDQQEFPEIDLEASSDEDEEQEDDLEKEAAQEAREAELEAAANTFDDDESIELEDSQAGDSDDQDDDEELGYNSSDIDNEDYDSSEEDERASLFAARSDASATSIEEELSRMLVRHSRKPDESASSTNKIGVPTHQAARAFDDTKNPDGSARGIFKKSSITGEMKRVYPEIEPNYDSDSSTEDPDNRIGNVPLEWYDDLPHIGYDINGRKVMKPATKDELDRFLDTVDGDGEAWFSARDNSTGKDVRLTDEELAIISKLQNAEIPDDAYDPYEDYVDWFTGPDKVMQTPLTSRPEPKSRFVPSKWEHKKVMKIVRAIREGRIVPGQKQVKDQKPKHYNIWADGKDDERSPYQVMAAPKLPLPGHSESYNPPQEYLFNEDERKEWEQAEPEDRKQNFLPSKYDSLRHVPGYTNFVQERFERCLDLYLAPRMMRRKIDIHNPENLLPKLPSPKELRPFPTMSSIVYPHEEFGVRVRCLSIDNTGNWLLTGADDGKVRLWDVETARLTASWDICQGFAKSERSAVHSVAWCPTKDYSLFAATVNGRIAIIAPPQTQNYNKTTSSSTGINSLVSTKPSSRSASSSSSLSGVTATSTPSFLYATSAAATSQPNNVNTKAPPPTKWSRPTESERRLGVAMYISVGSGSSSSTSHSVKSVVWHHKGDYFATVCPDSTSGSSVLIHQLSKHRSQAPFKRASKGSSVQKVVFHPTNKPWLFVATQRYIRIYDLMAQKLVKTLQTGLKWVSCIDVHPSGDHLIVGSYDKKTSWFDLDFSNKPWKVLKYHSKAVRQVAFSTKYNLFADSSDDGTLQLFYANANSQDLDVNVTLVPLKILKKHQPVNGLGVLDIKWHPTQPWIFSAGADGNAILWSS